MPRTAVSHFERWLQVFLAAGLLALLYGRQSLHPSLDIQLVSDARMCGARKGSLTP